MFSQLCSDPSNLMLVMICFGIVGLMFHGKTIVKVPRYSSYEIESTESGQQWVLDADSGFKRLEEETAPMEDPSKHPNWQPPCLPEEAPDFEEKQRKMKELQENLEKMDVVELIENRETLDTLVPIKGKSGDATNNEEDVVIEEER